MTPEERAEAVADYIRDEVDDAISIAAREAITSAIREAENEALERAAAKCERFAYGATFARRIRSLKTEDPQ